MFDVLPNDRRGFVHKRIFGGAIGFLTGGPGGAVKGFVGGGGGPAVATADSSGGCSHLPGTRAAGPGQPCLPISSGLPSLAATGCGVFQVFDPVTKRCVFGLGQQPGREPGGVGGGNVVMGQFGAAMVPDVNQVRTLDCLPGMILGKDSLCYNKRDLTNTQRKWPRGRRPLLTGGDRNAITRAARAAKAIQRTEKQLQKMGMLRKPTPRRSYPKPKMLTSGDGVRVVNVE